MQIEYNIGGGYDKKLSGSGKTEHLKASESSGSSRSSSQLSGLREGSVFKGEILEINGEKVKIAIENKAELVARLQAGVELGVGDRLLFSVQENNSSHILIKPMFDSLYSAQSRVLEQALEAAGLSPTEKNFCAAKELMEAGLPLDKGNMIKLLSQSMKYPETSMQTLVGLNRLNIPVTEANIFQYERYQGYRHQLTGDIAKAVDSIAAFADAFPRGISSASLLLLANQILDIFTLPQNGTDTGGAAQTLGNMGNLTGDSFLQAEAGNMDGSKSEIIQSAIGNEKQEAEASVMSKELTGTSEQAKDISFIKSTGTPIAFEQNGMAKEDFSALINMLSKAGISEGEIQLLFQSSGSTQEFLKNMLSLSDLTGGNDTVIRSILDSNAFRKLFSDVIKRQWMLNPKEMKDPAEIDELYNKIMKQSRSFEDAVASKGGDTKNFNQNFQNMRQNMQFTEQLNQQMIYAQMPLKLSNRNANSELYVYADKRKLMEKRDGISIMLHLDMDYLGMTDIKVTLTGTNVNARFYLNDQKSVELVTDNMEQLAEQLAERGFSLTNEVVKRTPQESINKVVDEIIDENAERSIKRYTFDART